MLQVDRVDELRREVKRLKFVVVTVVAVVAVVMVSGFASAPSDARFGTLTVERLNVIEPDGLYRAVLTNSKRSPGPMKAARDGAAEGKRNFPIAGLILYDDKGHEVGGYGSGSSANSGSIAVRAIDWGDARGEAVTTFRRVGPDGMGVAGTWIYENPPAGENPKDEVDRRRIKLQVPGRDAEVLLADERGRDRIVLRVDEGGDAFIEVRDSNGEVTFRAPEVARSPKSPARD